LWDKLAILFKIEMPIKNIYRKETLKMYEAGGLPLCISTFILNM
jgi:hypothetical protein